MEASYVCAKELHSVCLNLIIFMISKSVSKDHGAVHDTSEHVDMIDRLKLYASFTQENLVGLISSAIKTNKNTFKHTSPQNEAENNIDLTTIKAKLVENTSVLAANQLNLYQLIKFLLNLLHRNNDIQFDDTVFVMFINLLKYLLVESEPSRVDSIAKEFITDFGADLSEEYLLELVLNWIDQFMQFNQLSVAASYFNLIYELNENATWKPRVANFLNHIFTKVNMNDTRKKINLSGKGFKNNNEIKLQRIKYQFIKLKGDIKIFYFKHDLFRNSK